MCVRIYIYLLCICWRVHLLASAFFIPITRIYSDHSANNNLSRLRCLTTDLFVGGRLDGARRKRLLLHLQRSGSARRCARRTVRRGRRFTVLNGILLRCALRLHFRSSEISGCLLFWRYHWLIRWYRGRHAARDRWLFRGQDTTAAATTCTTGGGGSGCLNSGACGRT